MSLYAGDVTRKEKELERKRNIQIDAAFYEARTGENNPYKLFVDKTRENGESIVASDFFDLNPLWKRMRKRKDHEGIFVFLGGSKCYENEWLRI